MGFWISSFAILLLPPPLISCLVCSAQGIRFYHLHYDHPRVVSFDLVVIIRKDLRCNILRSFYFVLVESLKTLNIVTDLIIKFIKAKTKDVTRCFIRYVQQSFTHSFTQSISQRLSLPVATPKLTVNCSPRLTISARLCQTLNLSISIPSLTFGLKLKDSL